MRKQKAIELLGGSISAAAGAIGVSYQAISQWPDELPPRIADRVVAHVARKKFPELVGAGVDLPMDPFLRAPAFVAGEAA